MSLASIENFIDGNFSPSASGEWLENFEPATGQVSGRVANSNADDVTGAVEAAQRAFPKWSGLTMAERSRYLHRIALLIEREAAMLARAESNDTGKTLRQASTVDIPRAALNFRFFAGAALGYASQSHAAPGAINYTLRQPLGAVGCISPWNLPLYLLTWKIAPALAMGNCVVAKPSELTPVTAAMLGKLCQEAELPHGVLNIVHGVGGRAGEALVVHDDICAISFTGGTKTGRQIASLAAPRFKKLSLELGGKNPNIIFADCDYDKMLAATLRSSFSNQGQICLCGSRIYVERSLYARFRDDFVNRARRLQVGDPLDESSDLGAVISQSHQQKILKAIEEAQRDGGRVLCGGVAQLVDGRCRDGWFVAPTVIEGLELLCAANQEEIFGPVVTIQPFDTDEEGRRVGGVVGSRRGVD